jgi:hypothetical protein
MWWFCNFIFDTISNHVLWYTFGLIRYKVQLEFFGYTHPANPPLIVIAKVQLNFDRINQQSKNFHYSLLKIFFIKLFSPVYTFYENKQAVITTNETIIA